MKGGHGMVCRKVGGFVLFPTGFLISFACENLAKKVTNDDHVSMECCNHHNCELVAKHLNCSHLIIGVMQWPEL